VLTPDALVFGQETQYRFPFGLSVFLPPNFPLSAKIVTQVR